jgi:hypothetical protein
MGFGFRSMALRAGRLFLAGITGQGVVVTPVEFGPYR